MDKEKNSIERQKFQMIKSGFDIIGKWLEKIASRDTNKVEIAGVSVITLKGEPGKDAHTPTDEELLSLIKPLIPLLRQPEDGHTPTESELLELIKPLIPSVKDGETPSDEKLLSLIRPLIPEIDEKPIIEEVKKLTIEELKTLIPKTDSPEEIINKLLSIKKAWLPAEAINGDIIQHITRIVKQFGGSSGGISEARVIEIINSNSTFLKLTDTFSSYTGLAGKGLRVNLTETGIDTYTPTDTDEKVKYNASDLVAGYLADKVIAGNGITLSEGTGADADKLKITNSGVISETDPVFYTWIIATPPAYQSDLVNYLKIDQTTPQTTTGTFTFPEVYVSLAVDQSRGESFVVSDSNRVIGGAVQATKSLFLGTVAGVDRLAHFDNDNATTRTEVTYSNSGSGAWEDNFVSFMVHGSSFLYGNIYLTDYAGKTSDSGWAYLLGQGTSQSGLAIATYNTVPILFGTNNVTRGFITSGGSWILGNGTTVDNEVDKLQVLGNVHFENTDGSSSFLTIGNLANGYGSSAYLNLQAGNSFTECFQSFRNASAPIDEKFRRFGYDYSGGFSIGQQLNDVATEVLSGGIIIAPTTQNILIQSYWGSSTGKSGLNFTDDGINALQVGGSIAIKGMPTADPADGTNALWTDPITRIVYLGT